MQLADGSLTLELSEASLLGPSVHIADEATLDGDAYCPVGRRLHAVDWRRVPNSRRPLAAYTTTLKKCCFRPLHQILAGNCL